jgi:hypothetical protein
MKALLSPSYKILYTGKNGYMQGLGYINAIVNPIEEKIEEKIDKKCVIMPNPTNGFVTVKTSGFLNEIEIFSIEEQTLFKRKCNGTSNYTIDLTGYDAGVYFIKISLFGGESLIRKVILTK